MTVKYRHFETLRPVCPVCVGAGRSALPLLLSHVANEAQECVIEGLLQCSYEKCLCEFPIVDGIPLLVPNVCNYISNNVAPLTARKDLSESLEHLLADGCGPGSTQDILRQHVSTYAWDHYAEFDPRETEESGAGSIVRVLRKGLTLRQGPLSGPVLDVGCSVGRSSLELAQETRELVLGVDLNFSMLRLANRVLHEQEVRYERRRIGMLYERRHFPVHFPQREWVDFWACDALALPFAPACFGSVVGLNVLDCVSAPLHFLQGMRRVLRDGGSLLLSTPYDWSGQVTSTAAWIGGHSPRSFGEGACDEVLRALLTPGAHVASIPGLRFQAEISETPWLLRLHERSRLTYQVHLVLAEAESLNSTHAAEVINPTHSGILPR